jgi:carbamoylphosphate synthase large subunit
MKKVLILGTKRFTNYLSECETSEQFNQRYDVELLPLLEIKKHFGSYAAYLQHQITSIENGEIEADAITGTNDTSSLIAAGIASTADISGPKFHAVINCQDKKRSRDIQRKHLPEHTVACQAISSDGEPHPGNDFPIFIKPQRSSLSKFATHIDSKQSLQNAARRWEGERKSFNKTYRHLIRAIPDRVKKGYIFHNQLLAEESFDLPRQVTVDGICTNGHVRIVGVTFSHFLENTLSFSAFHTPHSFKSEKLRKRIFSAVTTLVRVSNFNNGWFNVEVAYDPTENRVVIIEINARMSSQFALMHDHVLEPSVLELLTKTACGDTIASIPQHSNRHARCYILRKQYDALVERRPTKEEIDQLKNKYPEAHIHVFAKRNKYLSSLSQDEYTFRYAQIHVLSHTPNDCQKIYQEIKKDLENMFVFKNASSLR